MVKALKYVVFYDLNEANSLMQFSHFIKTILQGFKETWVIFFMGKRVISHKLCEGTMENLKVFSYKYTNNKANKPERFRTCKFSSIPNSHKSQKAPRSWHILPVILQRKSII